MEDHTYAEIAEQPDNYEEAQEDVQLTQEERRDFRLKIVQIELLHPEMSVRKYLLPDESLEVRCTFEVSEPLDDVVFGIAIYNLDGQVVFGINTEGLGLELGSIQPGKGSLSFLLRRLALLDGEYFITIGVHNTDGFIVYDWHEQKHHFQVSNPERSVGQVHIPISVTTSLADTQDDTGMESATNH